MTVKYRKVVDERGNALPGLLKSEFGMIVDVNSIKYKRYLEEKTKIQRTTKEKQELDLRLKELENNFSTVKDDVSEIKNLLAALLSQKHKD